MKKRIFAIVMSVCLLFTALSCVASAAGEFSVAQTLPNALRLCPGTVLGETDKLVAPDVYGAVYSQGWEIKNEIGQWVPYTGEPLEPTDCLEIRYYAVPFTNDHSAYAYSNEIKVIVQHNPTGEYLYSGTHHWRVCADCGGGEDVKEVHSHFDGDATSDTGFSTCTVCGAHRTTQWTGLAGFFQWLFDVVIPAVTGDLFDFL